MNNQFANIKSLFLLFFLFGGFLALAQPGWNWPENDSLKSIALEKQAFYKVSMGLENWEDANRTLVWLYQNNPGLHKSIYQDGVKVLEKILKTSISNERKELIEDSVLIVFDQRIKHFQDSSEVMDRKAYSAFKMYYNQPAKYSLLATLYDKAYELNGSGMSVFNLTPYFTVASYYHKSNPIEMSSARVLDIHDKLTNVIKDKMKSGSEDQERLQKELNTIDALLSSMEDILSCDFIENQLVPVLKQNPDDLNTAKKIFSYSLKAKCSDKEYFTQAAEVIYADKPTYELASLIGNRLLSNNNFDKSLKYLNEALALVELDEDKYEVYIDIAILYSKMDKKNLSRETAYKALSIKSEDANAYNIIGNLYFKSSEECREGKSKVLDRAIFIAAYDIYQKAENTDQMTAAKAQFPSIEELFDENYSKGDKVKINCWINTTVELKVRD